MRRRRNEEEKGKDASADMFTQIFFGGAPHWLFLVTGVQFISLSFWDLSRGISSETVNFDSGVRSPLTHVLLNTNILVKFKGWLWSLCRTLLYFFRIFTHGARGVLRETIMLSCLEIKVLPLEMLLKQEKLILLSQKSL